MAMVATSATDLVKEESRPVVWESTPEAPRRSAGFKQSSPSAASEKRVVTVDIMDTDSEAEAEAIEEQTAAATASTTPGSEPTNGAEDVDDDSSGEAPPSEDDKWSLRICCRARELLRDVCPGAQLHCTLGGVDTLHHIDVYHRAQILACHFVHEGQEQNVFEGEEEEDVAVAVAEAALDAVGEDSDVVRQGEEATPAEVARRLVVSDAYVVPEELSLDMLSSLVARLLPRLQESEGFRSSDLPEERLAPRLLQAAQSFTVDAAMISEWREDANLIAAAAVVLAARREVPEVELEEIAAYLETADCKELQWRPALAEIREMAQTFRRWQFRRCEAASQ